MRATWVGQHEDKGAVACLMRLLLGASLFYVSLLTHKYALKLGSRANTTDGESILNSSTPPGVERGQLVQGHLDSTPYVG